MDQARLALRTWLVTGALPGPDAPQKWHLLLDAAEEQGLAGLLADAVVAAHDPWPTALCEELREAARRAQVRTARQLDLAHRAHFLLSRSGLRSLPLKGAAVAEWLYRSPGERPMSDVDLLALDAPADALRVLEEAGFQRVAHSEHAYALRDRATAGIVELHRSVTSCPALFPLDRDGLWQRRIVRSGQVPCVPCPSDLVVLLALHAAFQHGLVLTLSQWMDFRRLAESHAAATTAVPATLAARTPVARAVAAAVLASRHAVAAPFPSALVDWARDALPRGLLPLTSPSPISPLRHLAPARAPLARTRWAIASGRRLQLLCATLLPDPSADERGAIRALGRTLKRSLRLLRQVAGS